MPVSSADAGSARWNSATSSERSGTRLVVTDEAVDPRLLDRLVAEHATVAKPARPTLGDDARRSSPLARMR